MNSDHAILHGVRSGILLDKSNGIRLQCSPPAASTVSIRHARRVAKVEAAVRAILHGIWKLLEEKCMPGQHITAWEKRWMMYSPPPTYITAHRAGMTTVYTIHKQLVL